MELIICEYDICKLYLVDPVVLPCGKTVCKEHLDHLNANEDYICLVCNDEHSVPKKGFAINEKLQSFIRDGSHLTGSHRQATIILKNIEEKVQQYQYFDATSFIYDYFANIRNKIDLHRELIINNLNTKSENLLKKLSFVEKKCQQKAAGLSKPDINNLVIFLNKEKAKLRRPDFSDWNSLIDSFSKKLDDLIVETSAISKESLLMNLQIEFKPKNDIGLGDLIITKSLIDDKNVQDVGNFIRSYEGHSDFVYCAEIIENQFMKFLISASQDKTVKIWNLDTRECIQTLDEHKDEVYCIVLLSNSKFATGSADRTVKFWEIDSTKSFKTLKNDNPVSTMAILSHNILLCGLNNGKISIWDLKQPHERPHKIIKGHERWINCIKTTNDESKLITCSSDHTINIWSLVNFSKIYKPNLIKQLKGHQNVIYHLDIFSNSQEIISCSHDKSLNVWSICNGSLLEKHIFKNKIDFIKLVTDSLVLVGLRSCESNLILYDLKDMVILKKFSGHTDWLTSFNVLSNGNQLISCSRDNTIKLWQI